MKPKRKAISALTTQEEMDRCKSEVTAEITQLMQMIPRMMPRTM